MSNKIWLMKELGWKKNSLTLRWDGFKFSRKFIKSRLIVRMFFNKHHQRCSLQSQRMTKFKSRWSVDVGNILFFTHSRHVAHNIYRSNITSKYDQTEKKIDNVLRCLAHQVSSCEISSHPFSPSRILLCTSLSPFRT